MPADELMMMFIRGMTVDYGDQKLLFRDGRMRLANVEKMMKKQHRAVKNEEKKNNILVKVYRIFNIK